MKHYVYVLKSINHNRRYVGMTIHPEERLLEHNGGHTKSTKGYRPWTLVYKEEFDTLQEARNREIFLKSGIGRAFLDQLHL